MTQKQLILQKLETGEWVSLADALNMNPPCYRLSERIRELKKLGYEIESRRVKNKTYQEYKLVSSILVLEEKKSDNLGNGGSNFSNSPFQETPINKSVETNLRTHKEEKQGDMFHLQAKISL